MQGRSHRRSQANSRSELLSDYFTPKMAAPKDIIRPDQCFAQARFANCSRDIVSMFCFANFPRVSGADRLMCLCIARSQMACSGSLSRTQWAWHPSGQSPFCGHYGKQHRKSRYRCEIAVKNGPFQDSVLTSDINIGRQGLGAEKCAEHALSLWLKDFCFHFFENVF